MLMEKLKIARRVIVFDGDRRYLRLAKRYLDDFEEVESLRAISWWDLVFRRVRIVALPRKSDMHSFSERLKRKLIKSFALSLEKQLAEVNFKECIFGEHGDRVIFVPSYVAEIYRCHFPDFKVLELADGVSWCEMKSTIDLVESALKAGDLDEALGITVFTNVVDDANIRSYRKLHPNRRIVLRYHDHLVGDFIKNCPENILSMIERLRRDKVIDELESYSKCDADQIGGSYRPSAVSPKIISQLQQPVRNALYRFLGTPKNSHDQTRSSVLNEVREQILHDYPKSFSWIEERVFPVQKKSWKPYETYLAESMFSEVVVDLTRLDQEEGFSYRVPEALFSNRKIISNRLILRGEPFYSPERVFLIGVDPISRLKSFLETDIEPLPESILRLYDASLWWTSDDPRRDDRQTDTTERRRDFMR